MVDAWPRQKGAQGMAARGRIYRRGLIYYIAYRWDGREYRESARSTDVGVAEGSWRPGWRSAGAMATPGC